MLNLNVMAIFQKHLSLPFLAFATISLMSLRMVNSSDSLSFNFPNFHQRDERLYYQGDAHITSDNVAHLTATDGEGVPQKNSVGRLVHYTKSESPNRLSSFETNFTFELTSARYLPADGFTFFMAEPWTVIPEHSSGGLFGLFNRKTALNPKANKVVAVEFDTFYDKSSNSWDPNYEHIGIDLNSIKSSAHVRWERKGWITGTARINYNAATKNLSVVSSYDGFQQQYVVSHIVDLRTVLPEWVRVGLSAATGGECQVHKIRSWSFRSEMINTKAKEEEMYIARVV